MKIDEQNQQEQEMLALSDDFFSVEELEERLELAAVSVVDSLCTGNACGGNACGGNYNGSGW
ncbi:hypothetical protein EPA93_17580 [Ktedonosporobacter rubrisoli]|uniref:Uncharacterized protein n=1 Tax=Ktedonosporobacter rubrisoli TaxID=2509675 RepID=A0A4P6JQX0_KTERU|nr:hypothetical protein [Ktedonosporobacter rubrisoli]QBD77704.1 hypothetical protein EPA93_17580 [Ktedonosporobacter rubrisoli]